jgi:hypothetical protein
MPPVATDSAAPGQGLPHKGSTCGGTAEHLRPVSVPMDGASGQAIKSKCRPIANPRQSANNVT